MDQTSCNLMGNQGLVSSVQVDEPSEADHWNKLASEAKEEEEEEEEADDDCESGNDNQDQGPGMIDFMSDGGRPISLSQKSTFDSSNRFLIDSGKYSCGVLSPCDCSSITSISLQMEGIEVSQVCQWIHRPVDVLCSYGKHVGRVAIVSG
jgi:hypothetical protein